MIIEVKAKFPIEWDRTYYAVGYKEKSVFAPCVPCDDTGKVTIKGEEYKCPKCNGNWREKKVVSKTRVYHVEKYKLSEVKVTSGGIQLRFEQKVIDNRCGNNINIRQSDFETMKIENSYSERYLFDDQKTATAEVKRLNAESKSE